MQDNLVDTALKQAAACAREKYAGEEKRISKGELIARNGGVILHTDTYAQVRSDRDPEVVYQIHAGRCDCPDASNAPDFRCKHVFAVIFVTIALQALERVCPSNP